MQENVISSDYTINEYLHNAHRILNQCTTIIRNLVICSSLSSLSLTDSLNQSLSLSLSLSLSHTHTHTHTSHTHALQDLMLEQVLWVVVLNGNCLQVDTIQ